MDLNLILQLAVSGLLTGALYGLAALGLALAFGVLKVLNVAHGELIMLGGYATFVLFDRYDIHPLAALPLVFVILMVVGLVLHLVLFRFVVSLGVEDRIKNSLLISFGLVLILQSLATRAFTADERSLNLNLTSWAVGPLRLPPTRVAALVIAVLAVILLEWALHHTTFGKAIRATSEDWSLALLSGINIQRVYLATFAIAAGVAGIAGSTVAVVFNISPHIGLFWTLKALIVVVLAGLGSIRGTVTAGLLLGLTEGVATVWIGGQYREVVALVVLLVVLMVKPQGLTGRSHE